MYSIQNHALQISVKTAGAELTSIRSVNSGIEYLWQADPEVWGSHAPILFPIVGELKEGKYQYNNQTYQLSRHGFFRRNDKVELVDQSEDHLTFSLKADQESAEAYPFDFELRVTYRLKDHQVHVEHEVINHGDDEMLFSLGGHPGFNCPLHEGEDYEDYYLEFDEEEFAHIWALDGNGLIAGKGQLLLDHSKEINLHRHLFDDDALVFKHLKSSRISLKSRKSAQVLRVDFANWPFLGIWAKSQAPYVCIEPWLGIADSVDADQHLKNKEGIISLSAGSRFEATYVISIEEE